MRISDFDYELPPERIAQEPCEPRDQARLLVFERRSGRTEHRAVADLPSLLDPRDLVLFNDTRVLRARLFARRASGGRIEILLLEPAVEARGWRAFLRPARRLHPGETLALEGGTAHLRLVERARAERGEPGMEWVVHCEDGSGADLDPLHVMERFGHVPLPPYVRREDDEHDRERYQTVFARVPGAVAAPTAGLHFTPELLLRLDERGIRRATVTLHVGAGTFQPVKSERIEDHAMHAERYELPEPTAEAVRETRARGGRVVAIGTTVARVLESGVSEDGVVRGGTGGTRLFLYPGVHFRAVDALLTNFHLPRSTLLMLVSAFAGRERVLALYREALERGYRFYSYGDAMLIL
jgi:S-adenosylmethionine:tRNA ribosyltransferase-isomerase